MPVTQLRPGSSELSVLVLCDLEDVLPTETNLPSSPLVEPKAWHYRRGTHRCPIPPRISIASSGRERRGQEETHKINLLGVLISLVGGIETEERVFGRLGDDIGGKAGGRGHVRRGDLVCNVVES